MFNAPQKVIAACITFERYLSVYMPPTIIRFRGMMIAMCRFYFLLNLFLCMFSCSSSGKNPIHLDDTDDVNVMVYDFPLNGNRDIVVDSILDLQCKCYRIPANQTLIFRGGTIKNGVLIGNNTKIIGSDKLFDNVTIRGTWIVEKISTKMFCNLKDTNSLKNVFALANTDINNEIYIQKGNYIVKATTKQPNILNIPSKTQVVIDGTISMVANDFKRYSIINVSKSNTISIMGNGSLIGDRVMHTGQGGEWGMCISTYDADNILIRGLSMSKAWGDGIYVGKGTKKISISGCKIDSCRRQGISVIEGTDVVIKDCIITNICGTAPEYAIDIEPNTLDTVTNVRLEDINIDNCIGGISLFAGEKKKCFVDSITIDRCRISGASRAPIKSRGASRVSIKNCTFQNNKAKYTVFIQRSSDVKLLDNIISTDKYVLYDLGNIKMMNNKILKGTLTPPLTKKKVKSFLGG